MPHSHLRVRFEAPDCGRFLISRRLEEESDQCIEQLRLFDRFGEIGGEDVGFIARFTPTEGTEQHQREFCLAANLLCQFEAVHFGHVHVENGYVESFSVFDPLQGSEGRICFAGSHAPFGGLRVEDVTIGGVVIHDEHVFVLKLRLDTRVITFLGGR